MADTTERVRYEFEVVTDSAIKELTDFSDVFESVGSGFKRLGTMTNSLSKSIKASTKVFTGFTKAAKAFTGVAIGKGFAEATKEAIDFYETLNLFQVAMKDSIDAGNEFIDNVSEWYGLDPANLMEYTGTFYEMAYAVGAPAEAARTLSTSLTALSVDLASLFNVDVEKVTDNLTSGIRGASRAVVKYGLDLRATTVEAFANAHGITEQYETMNEASREILRYATAVTQAKDATGDFARTLEQPANQLRVFKEQMTQVGRAIGTFFVQPLRDALPVINGYVMAIRVMLETVASLVGVSMESEYTQGFDGATESVDQLGASADATKKKIKSLVAPFDELNILKDNSSSEDEGLGYGTVDPAILGLLDSMEYELEAVRMRAHDVRDAILQFFGFTPTDGVGWLYAPELFQERLNAYLPNWQSTIESLFNFNGEALLGNFRLLFYQIGTIISEAVQLALQDLGQLLGIEITDTSLSDWIDHLNEKFIEFRGWLHENQTEIANTITRVAEIVTGLVLLSIVLGPITDLLFTLGGVAFVASTMFNVLATSFSTISTLVSGAFTLFSNFIGFLTTGFSAPFLALIAVVVAGFVTAFTDMWRNSETFRDNFSILWNNFMLLIGEIVELVKNVVKAVWNIVKPAIDFFASIFAGMLIPIQHVIDSIIKIFLGLVEMLNGILTGDMTKVVQGFFRVVSSLVTGITSAIVTVINGVLGAVRGAFNWLGGKIHSWISGLLGFANKVLDVLGMGALSIPDKSKFQFSGTWAISMPNISDATAFATGGVVTGPTRALIGEAGRSEAVIPLDDSPQMRTLIQRIADAVENNNSKNPQPMEVRVYLDSREITSTQNRTNRMYGRTQQNF